VTISVRRSRHDDDGRNFTTYAPYDPMLVTKLQQKGVQITARPPSDNTPWFIALLLNALPFALFLGAWIFLSRQMQNGPAGPWASASRRRSC
jgi:cell division protease FtsH